MATLLLLDRRGNDVPARSPVYDLARDRVTIGRSPDCDIHLDTPSLSRRHAQLVRTETGYSFEDLGSPGGSCVGGVRVTERVPLRDGDLIHAGGVLFVYRSPEG